MHCNKITDEGLINLQNAKYVNIGDCDLITGEGLITLQNSTAVGLWNCDQISDAAKETLRSKGVKVYLHPYTQIKDAYIRTKS